MTYMELIDELHALKGRLTENAKSEERRHRMLRNARIAEENIASLAPKRKPTKAEYRKMKSGCLCAADVELLPSRVPDLEAEIDARSFALGMYNIANRMN
jgi:hypothetical protein